MCFQESKKRPFRFLPCFFGYEVNSLVEDNAVWDSKKVCIQVPHLSSISSGLRPGIASQINTLSSKDAFGQMFVRTTEVKQKEAPTPF